MKNKDSISRTFLSFAERECKGSSNLYENLSKEIAKDPTILELCLEVNTDQPMPNLLFGAIHYLLLLGIDHPLKGFYPSLVDNPKPFHKSFPFFKDFCLTYRNEIKEILKKRIVQTNEVRRYTYLYPLFFRIYEQTKKHHTKKYSWSKEENIIAETDGHGR